MSRPILLSIIVVSALYWLASIFFTNRTLIEFSDGVALAFFGAVFITFFKPFWQGLWAKNPDRYSVLLVGIAGIGFAGGLQWLLRGAARVFEAEWLYNNVFIGYALVLSALFAAFHLLVRRSGSDDDPHKQVTSEAWALIVVTGIVGIAIGVLAVSIEKGNELWNGWPFL